MYAYMYSTRPHAHTHTQFEPANSYTLTQQREIRLLCVCMERGNVKLECVAVQE